MAAVTPTTVSAAEPEHLRGRIISGVGWKAASRLCFEASKVAVAVVLARLLTPHQFGLAGMVLVLSSVVPTFAGLAFGSALVQRKHITEDDKSTVFWASLVLGAACMLVGIACAGLLAKFYGEAAVRPLAAVLSVSFFTSAFGMTQSQLLVRDLRYRSLELRTMVATLSGAAVGIAAAFAGWGAWAIILQQVTFSCVASVLVWVVSDWRPSWRFSTRSLRELGRFGGHVSGSVLFGQLTQNVDNLLVGRYLGAAALGIYSLAYSVMLAPFTRLTSPLQEILYAAFSRIQDEPARLANIWLRANRLMGAVAIPLLLGLVAVAPDLIPLVFGSQWEKAVPVVQVLAWVGILEALQGLNASVLLARDRSRTYLRFSALLFVGSLVAFVIGLQWGVLGVAVCYAISCTLIHPIYTVVAVRCVGVRLIDFLRNLVGVAAAGVVMLAVTYAVRASLLQSAIPEWQRLVVTIAAGGLVYVGVLALFARGVFTDLQALRVRRAGSSAVAAQPAAGG